MIFSNANKISDKICDLFLAVTIFCICISLLGEYHWLFSLAEHFYHYYIFIIMGGLIYSALRKKLVQTLFLTGLISLLFIFHPEVKGTLYSSPEKLDFSHKIFYQNIKANNQEWEEIYSEVERKKPDSVALVEVSPFHKILISKLSKNYPFHEIRIRDDFSGIAILSKKRIFFQELLEERGILIGLKVMIDDVFFTLIHLPPPIGAEYSKIQKDIIDKLIKANNKRYVLVGDFNQTIYSHHFKKMLRSLRHIKPEEFLLHTTWPSFLPKFLGIGIDHVFSDLDFNIEMGDFLSSDHRYLFLYLRE